MKNSSHDVSTETQIPRPLAFLGSLIVEVSRRATRTLVGAWATADRWLFESRKSEYGLAVTRILFGVAALGILFTNFRTRLYAFGSGAAWNGEMAEPVSDFPRMWLFSAFHHAMSHDTIYTTLYILLIVLAVLIVLGWRFKVVAPVFFVLWVSFIESTDMLGDQGDNMYRIAFLLLMFTDAAARWSFDSKRRSKRQTSAHSAQRAQVATVIHNLALVSLIAQVVFVYTSGALYKAGGGPWREGWAVYHPLATARFGTWPVLSEFFTAWGPVVAMITLGTLFLQAAFPFMLLNRVTRIVALLGILGFHLGIALLMGLPWFSLTMIAIDAVFIRDRSWRSIQHHSAHLWRNTRARHPRRSLLSSPTTPDPNADLEPPMDLENERLLERQ